jgi:hypothetical protein
LESARERNIRGCIEILERHAQREVRNRSPVLTVHISTTERKDREQLELEEEFSSSLSSAVYEEVSQSF